MKHFSVSFSTLLVGILEIQPCHAYESLLFAPVILLKEIMPVKEKATFLLPFSSKKLLIARDVFKSLSNIYDAALLLRS